MDASIPPLLPRKNGTLFERWWRVNERANAAAEKTEGEPLVKSSGPFVSQAAGHFNGFNHPPTPKSKAKKGLACSQRDCNEWFCNVSLAFHYLIGRL
jgi:hypothetical protein